MAINYNADINDVRHLFDVAKNGRSKSARTRAKNKLEVILKKEANRANGRLRAMEKRGYVYGQAYDSAIYYLGLRNRKRFSAAIKSLDIAYAEYLRINAYLTSPTSTPTGYRSVIERRNQTFRTFFKDPEISDAELEDFQRFLGNQSVQLYLAFYDDSHQVVEKLKHLMEDDARNEMIRDLFHQYEEFITWRKEHPFDDISDANGLTFSELRERIDTLYESIATRRR